MATKSIPSAALVRELLHYDPETGVFRWRQSGSGRRASLIAGAVNRAPSGNLRINITINHKNYKAHQLAWLYVTGKWPPRQVDHKDTNSLDNRWVNLRLATRVQNRRNSGMARNNTSGFVGAIWDKHAGMWIARIRGKFLGRFKTAEEAGEAYRKAALEQYGEFAHSSLRPIGRPRRREK